MKTFEDPEGMKLSTSGEPLTEADNKFFEQRSAKNKAKRLNGHHLNGKKAKKSKKHKSAA